MDKGILVLAKFSHSVEKLMQYFLTMPNKNVKDNKISCNQNKFSRILQKFEFLRSSWMAWSKLLGWPLLSQLFSLHTAVKCFHRWSAFPSSSMERHSRHAFHVLALIPLFQEKRLSWVQRRKGWFSFTYLTYTIWCYLPSLLIIHHLLLWTITVPAI